MKYPCQGPNCHTQKTKDRFNKKTKRLRGRNAYHSANMASTFSIFCPNGCQNDWVAANVQNIVAQRPITFNRERSLVSRRTTYPHMVGLLKIGLTMNR